MKDNLKLVMKNAYANISNYKVACIIVMQNNQEVIGVNIENKERNCQIFAKLMTFLIYKAKYSKNIINTLIYS